MHQRSNLLPTTLAGQTLHVTFHKITLNDVDSRTRCAAKAFVSLLLLMSQISLGLTQTFSDSGFVSELVTTLPAFTPVGAAWAPDGRMFIWQKNGTIRILRDGALLP